MSILSHGNDDGWDQTDPNWTVAQVKKAVEAEREACAVIAEQGAWPRQIAEAIRARAGQPSNGKGITRHG